MTWLFIILLNGKVFLSVPNIPTEKGCNALIKEFSEDIPNRYHKNYSLKCYRVE